MAKYKFRLMFGSHLNEEPIVDNPDQKQMVIYRPGDIIDTHIDLATRFNSPDPLHGKKFDRVDYADYKAKEALAWMQAHQPEAYASYIKYMETIGQSPDDANLDKALTPNEKLPRTGADVFKAQGAPRNESLMEDLKGYTLRELQAYAETEEIDLEGATRKEEVLAKILEYVEISQPA